MADALSPCCAFIHEAQQPTSCPLFYAAGSLPFLQKLRHETNVGSIDKALRRIVGGGPIVLAILGIGTFWTWLGLAPFVTNVPDEANKPRTGQAGALRNGGSNHRPPRNDASSSAYHCAYGLFLTRHRLKSPAPSVHHTGPRSPSAIFAASTLALALAKPAESPARSAAPTARRAAMSCCTSSWRRSSDRAGFAARHRRPRTIRYRPSGVKSCAKKTSHPNQAAPLGRVPPGGLRLAPPRHLRHHAQIHVLGTATTLRLRPHGGAGSETGPRGSAQCSPSTIATPAAMNGHPP